MSELAQLDELKSQIKYHKCKINDNKKNKKPTRELVAKLKRIQSEYRKIYMKIYCRKYYLEHPEVVIRAIKRYNKSPKGIRSRKKYEKSDKNKKRQKRYETSEKGYIRQAKYRHKKHTQ